MPGGDHRPGAVERPVDAPAASADGPSGSGRHRRRRRAVPPLGRGAVGGPGPPGEPAAARAAAALEANTQAPAATQRAGLGLPVLRVVGGAAQRDHNGQ